MISITITLFNKAVFSWYNFNYPNALTAAQMVFALVFLAILKVRYNVYSTASKLESCCSDNGVADLALAVHGSCELSRL